MKHLLIIVLIGQEPTDIVFQFDALGRQTDMAWVVCPSPKDASRVLHKIQVSSRRQRSF